jgi:hypothetical protein
MLNVVHRAITSSEAKIVLTSAVTFSFAVLYIVDGTGEHKEIDRYDTSTNSSTRSALSIDQQSGEIHIDLNLLPFDFIYYKDIFIAFLDDTLVEVDRTKVFSLEPDINNNLAGVVKKLSHDFEMLCRVSGTTIVVFNKGAARNRCNECWDFDLDQRKKTNCKACSVSGDMYIIDSMHAKRIKTESKQIYSDKGDVVIENVIFQTYGRADMKKGTIIFETNTKEFFEVVDRKIANIGGIRTSTMIISKAVPSNDSRVIGAKELIK